MIGRRDVIGGMLLGLGAALGGGVALGVVATPASVGGRGLDAVLRGLVSDITAARYLGQRYLAANPTAAAAVAARGQALLALADEGSAAARARITADRAADFTAENIVTVDGWVLARSEAELLALVAVA